MYDCIDRGELLKTLYEDCKCMNSHFLAVVRSAPSINRWIPIGDALPEAFIYVICAGEEGMAILRHNGEVWVDDAGCIYPMSAITHWMPLPSTEGLT